MPRGGKRPGAGAPKGNLNALKNGRNSPRIREYMLNLLTMPEFAELLLFVMARKGRRRSGKPALSIPNAVPTAQILQYIASGQLGTDERRGLIELLSPDPSIKKAHAAKLRAALENIKLQNSVKHNQSSPKNKEATPPSPERKD